MPEVLQASAPELAASTPKAARPRILYHAVKRLLDVVLATNALVVTGPLILLGVLAVKLTSRGPAFYRAKRAGRSGKPFIMFKLRTMRSGTDRSEERRVGKECRS